MRVERGVEPQARRVLLHVGPPKTGTTTIQSSLRLGGEFIYPETASGSHHELAQRSLGLRGFEREPSLLLDIVTDLDLRSAPGLPIVLSAETFASGLLVEERLEGVRRLALRFPTELVIGLRTDDARFASLVSQLIRQGDVFDLEEYWSAVIQRVALQSDLVPRFLAAAPWSTAHVISIDGTDPDHLYKSFEAIIGSAIERVPMRNVRWPGIALTIMNELNRLEPATLPLAERREVAQRVVRVVTLTYPELLDRGLRPVPEEVMAPLRDRSRAALEGVRSMAAEGRLKFYEPPATRRPAETIGTACAGRARRRPVRPSGLILHVGPPKTGTSALQVFLAQNAAALRRLGLVYPRLDAFDVGRRGGVASGNGFTLASLMTGIATSDEADLLKRSNGVLQLLTRVRAELDDGSALRAALLSSEFLTRPSTDDIRRFRTIASSVFEDVHVIAFHRDPVDLLCSTHEQGMKTDMRLQQTLEEFWAGNGAHVLSQHLRTPLRYADVFGDAAVSVEWYAGADEDGRSLIRTFLEAATAFDPEDIERFLASDDVVLPERPVNRSLGPIGRELLRRCNVHGVDRETTRALASAIDRATPDHVRSSIAASAALRRKVDESTREVIDELRSRFLLDDAVMPRPEVAPHGSTGAVDEAGIRKQDELEWVLEGIAETLATQGRNRSRSRPFLRAADAGSTSVASTGQRVPRTARLVRRIRSHPIVRHSLGLLPGRARSALLRLADRMG
jgi:hypothetical protein